MVIVKVRPELPGKGDHGMRAGWSLLEGLGKDHLDSRRESSIRWLMYHLTREVPSVHAVF